MPKMNGNDHFFTFTSRLVHCCFVIIAFGPMHHTTVANPVDTTVMTNFLRADSPVWVGNLQSLLFIDADAKSMIRYTPGSPIALSVILETGADLAFLVPVKSNVTKFAVGFANRVGLFAWDGTPPKGTPAPLNPENYLLINNVSTSEGETLICGKVDVSGRLWVGTSYSTDNGTLRGRIYCVENSGNVFKVRDNIGVPYGIAWSLDNTQLYYSDTLSNSIVAISYDKDTGNLNGEAKDIFQLASQNITLPSIPNGMTVDTDGNVWLAVWQEALVLKIDPTNGTVLMKVDFPDPNSVSSVTFGGLNLEDMYVTTSNTLEHVTNTGSKGVGDYELDEPKWPMNPPPT